MLKSLTVEYRTWVSIKTRCYNEKSNRYKHYGAKGVTMCPEWRDSFDMFLADMGNKPVVEGIKYSIDRIGGAKIYSKATCRWATEKEQKRNRGDFNVKMTLGDETLLVIEWVERTGLSFGLITSRRNMGWSDEKILTTPNNGLGVHNRMAVIDTVTLKVYAAIRFAAVAFDLKEANLRGMLIGRVKNKTNIIYLKDYKPNDNQLNLPL